MAGDEPRAGRAPGRPARPEHRAAAGLRRGLHGPAPRGVRTSPRRARLMVAIGMALIFAGYAVSIWGYCLVRGYDVSFGNVFSSKWPGAQVSQNTPGQV